MKIDIKGNELEIKDLKEGETFIWNDKLYMKTDELNGDEEYICVNLGSGRTIHLKENTYVTLGLKLKIVLDE